MAAPMIAVAPAPVVRIKAEIVTDVAAAGRCGPIVAVRADNVEGTAAVVTQARRW